MKELTVSESKNTPGGSAAFNVGAGVVWGATFGAVLGIPTGPMGIASGAITGAYNGAAAAVAREGAQGLIKIQEEAKK